MTRELYTRRDARAAEESGPAGPFLRWAGPAPGRGGISGAGLPEPPAPLASAVPLPAESHVSVAVTGAAAGRRLALSRMPGMASVPRIIRSAVAATAAGAGGGGGGGAGEGAGGRHLRGFCLLRYPEAALAAIRRSEA